MTRTKAFDRDDALDRGLHLFWARGYDATSMDDLLRGMDLSKSSFYQTFGSKHDLLLAALDRYIATVVEVRARGLADGPAESAISRAFLGLLKPNRPGSGCFIHNCAIELAARDAQAREGVARGLARLERGYRDAIQHGQDAGAFRTDCDAQLLAMYLSSSMFGFQVQLRAGARPHDLKKLLAVVLSTLRVSATKSRT